MKIALATCAALPDLDGDDQLLLPALQAIGLDARPVIWSDPAVDWSTFDLCVLRSTWDYVPQREAYVAWAERVAGLTSLCNPAEVIRWNTDKTYLMEIAHWGVPIVETQWLEAGADFDFAALLNRPGWRDVVVKPVVSSSGADTIRVNPDTLAGQRETLAALLQSRALMVQPYLPSVAETGELSFLFMNGQFSHATIKTPGQDDFRVQEHLGGLTRPYTPTEAQLTFARDVMNALPWPTLYARVDAMLDAAGDLRLSELELTEPSMYLAHDPHSPARFAGAIREQLAAVCPG